MGRLRFVLVLLASLCLAGPPIRAIAAERVLLGWGQTYTVSGATRTHRGIDIAADEGEDVSSFVAGEVTFAGRIPSDSGGSVLAVTVRSADGLVTVHPLAECRVSAGACVAEGDVLGAVAASGDASAGGTHVHLSMRVDGDYVDPGFLLGAEVMEPVTSAEDGEVPAATPLAAGVTVSGVALTVTSPVPTVIDNSGVVMTPAETPAAVATSVLVVPHHVRESPNMRITTPATGLAGLRARTASALHIDAVQASWASAGLLAAVAASAIGLTAAAARQSRTVLRGAEQRVS